MRNGETWNMQTWLFSFQISRSQLLQPPPPLLCRFKLSPRYAPLPRLLQVERRPYNFLSCSNIKKKLSLLYYPENELSCRRCGEKKIIKSFFLPTLCRIPSSFLSSYTGLLFASNHFRHFLFFTKTRRKGKEGSVCMLISYQFFTRSSPTSCSCRLPFLLMTWWSWRRWRCETNECSVAENDI